VGIIIPLWLLCGIVAAIIGAQKGEGCVAFIVGILLGPFGVLLALLSPGNQKSCPYCRKMIHEDATICPYCQKQQVGREKVSKTRTEEGTQEGSFLRTWSRIRKSVIRFSLFILLGSVILFVITWLINLTK